MVQGSALIELLNDRVNSIKLDNAYTQGIKDGIEEAIDMIRLAETISPFKEMEVANV